MPNSLRVLVVEDDTDLRNLLAEALEHLGATPTKTESGNAALEILRSKRSNFDIVLSDVRMPDGDGVFLLRELRKIDSTLPFIFLTGFADVTEDDAQKLGAQMMLHKPVNLLRLKAVLKEFAKPA